MEGWENKIPFTKVGYSVFNSNSLFIHSIQTAMSLRQVPNASVSWKQLQQRRARTSCPCYMVKCFSVLPQTAQISKYFPSRTWTDQLDNCLLPQHTPGDVPWVTAPPGVRGRCPASQAYEMAQPSVFLLPQFLLWPTTGDPVLQRSTPVSLSALSRKGWGNLPRPIL